DDGQVDTPDTLAFWRRLREASDAASPDALLVGEAWADSSVVAGYLGTAQAPALHMAFDFETAGGLVDALITGHSGAVRAALCARLDGWPEHGAAGSFVTNHDMRRLASRLQVQGPEALRLTAAALMTLPGTPWIYYGQELGLRNGPGTDDIAKRLPMQWEGGEGVGFTTGTPWAAPQSVAGHESVAGQTDDPDSLLAWYRRLISLRSSRPSLQRGSAELLTAEGSAGAPLVLRRMADEEVTLVVLNVASEPSTITLTSEALLGAGALVDVFSGALSLPDSTTGAVVLTEVPAHGVRILAPQ
ncbi:MAG: alpha-amylase family glycosyl hydrolase, partial [Myxococcota bacterium]|nr:alpha-amylase family glycosyl hydrolase [Myxococcota bacterium]